MGRRYRAVSEHWLKPDDIDTSFRRIMILTMPEYTRHSRRAYVVQRVHHVDAASNHRSAGQSTPMGSANGAHSAGGRGHGTAAGAGAD